MKVDKIELRDETPSVLSFRQLYCWTKYRVGRIRGDHYRYGAVKPPDARFHWFPAAIGRESILIATTESFSTPEKAVAWLRREGQAGRRGRRSTRPAQTTPDS